MVTDAASDADTPPPCCAPVFLVWGFGFGVKVLMYRVPEFHLRVEGLGFRVQVFWFRV
jgi:hypothetical protein